MLYGVSLTVFVVRKWWVLRAGTGELIGGWPVTIARQLNTPPLITRLHPLDLTLLVSRYCQRPCSVSC